MVINHTAPEKSVRLSKPSLHCRTYSPYIDDPDTVAQEPDNGLAASVYLKIGVRLPWAVDSPAKPPANWSFDIATTPSTTMADEEQQQGPLEHPPFVFFMDIRMWVVGGETVETSEKQGKVKPAGLPSAWSPWLRMGIVSLENNHHVESMQNVP
jgi:hypothetical protein